MSQRMIWPNLPLPRGCMGVQPSSIKGACAMGVDVHYGRWDVGIADVQRPTGDRKVARLVFYGPVRDIEDVLFLANQYPVAAGCCDSRPEGAEVKRLVDRLCKQGRDFWRVQYNTNPSDIELTINHKERLITAERTMTLDNVFFALNSGLGLALPQNWREIGGRERGEDIGAFGQQMMASTRVPVEWHGRPYDKWTEGEDHSFHVTNLLMIAIGVGKLHLPRGELLMPSKGIVVSRTMTGRGDPLSDDDDDDDSMFWDEGGGKRESPAGPMSWEG